jgi:hypothetical protein
MSGSLPAKSVVPLEANIAKFLLPNGFEACLERLDPEDDALVRKKSERRRCPDCRMATPAVVDRFCRQEEGSVALTVVAIARSAGLVLSWRTAAGTSNAKAVSDPCSAPRLFPA